MRLGAADRPGREEEREMGVASSDWPSIRSNIREKRWSKVE